MSHQAMLEAAVRHLGAADPALAAVMARVGPCRYEPDASGTHFGALLRSIVSQQLSTGAARTIHGRLLAHFGGDAPTPGDLLACDDEALRAVGLSRQKIAYMRDLAARVASGSLELTTLDALSDEAIIAALSAVHGIGRWTVQMLLIFRMGRLDVLPELDLGIQKGLMRADGLAEMPKPRAVLARGLPWAPYRTVAAWYLWRSLDLPPG